MTEPSDGDGATVDLHPSASRGLPEWQATPSLLPPEVPKADPPKADPLAGGTRRRLGAGLATFVLVAVLSVLYSQILRDLAWQWSDDANYSHGFMVPLFSGFLVWRRRKELEALPPRGSWLGLPVLLAGIGALILGDVGAELFLMRSSLILILAGLILFHLGPQIFRVVAFPLFFLFFMVPLPAIIFYAVTFPLQNVAAQGAARGLDLLGVPVLLDGNVIPPEPHEPRRDRSL
jgi:hypothetical protein